MLYPLVLQAFWRSTNPVDGLPKFLPMIATTGTKHYKVGKYRSELLQLLTQKNSL